ncbi:MAG: cytochrome c biogenesis heme-transporting ATPase CcmA [Acidiferrobacterales bacterium]|nr:cytochrome c biogenesis heme-transporting ATPase CcmA [Acidiferrobacterales bacterium]
MSNSLSASNLSCTRSERSLFTKLDLQAHSGQCLHVVGANGSGKSSLLRILCGLLTPDEGVVLWNQEPISNSQSYLQGLAYIGHKDALKNELTAAENLKFYQSCDSQLNDDLIDDHLNQLEILQCADLVAQKLSFGQRRRLAFARLQIKNYPIWILDEPFTGIDHKGRELIESLCLGHCQTGGIIILTNHQDLRASSLQPCLQEIAL